MNITSVYYLRVVGNISGLKAVIDGNESFVPMVPGNLHYAEIMRRVEASELVIQEEVTE